ncbi:MAG: MaoC family dehydratase [Deltaproteobacteria bacterium]|nr:MaoC family dehydratase [Deltaproteobacteria bacterium]
MNALKTFTFEALTKEQIRDYCEASGDWNRIHHDEAFAKEAGLGGIIAHGMLSMGLAARALEEWGFSAEKLKNLEAKFKDIAKPGDILSAELLETTPQIRCRVINQKGAEIVSVSATL